MNNTPDIEDNQYKIGVQIHRLEDILKEYPKGSVYIRHIIVDRNELFYEKLSEIHKEIHNKPYDINPYDWLCAKLNIISPFKEDNKFRKTTSFWCSALLSYIYCKLDWIDDTINWSLMGPREFSSDEGKEIKFKCMIGLEKNIY
jgi:hypothetical protein